MKSNASKKTGNSPPVTRLVTMAIVAGVALWFLSGQDHRWWQTLPAQFVDAFNKYKANGPPPLTASLPNFRARENNNSNRQNANAQQAEVPVTTKPAVVTAPQKPESAFKPIDVSSLFANFGVPRPAPHPPFMQPVPSKLYKASKGCGQPVKFGKRKIDGVSFYETIVDLDDPDCFVAIKLANGATEANDPITSHGDEDFESLVRKANGAVVINGTFFSKDDQKRVMGNMVSEGRFLKFSQWENYGTTLGLKPDNTLEMVTAREEGQPPWSNYWFSITCGPRLVKESEIWVNPELEGFSDSHVLGIGPRCAIGFPKSRDRLFLITFLSGLSLPAEAKIMQDIGCAEAMNLDGGASRALAQNNEVLVKAGRPLTNVIVVYDNKHRAPDSVVDSWHRFVEGARATAISRL